MRRKLLFLLCAILATAVGAVGSRSVAEAAADYTSKPISLTEVQDIGVYNDYKTNEAIIDTRYSDGMDGYYIYKLTLEKDGLIQLVLSAKGVTKTVIKTGKGSNVTPSDAVVTATIYRDQKMLYAVVPTVTAQGAKIGESARGIALDQGTYYIAIKTDPYSFVSTADSATTTTVAGKSDFIVYYQRVDSDELFRPSSVGKENVLTFDTVFKSLLTVPNPKDYYLFELTDKALVKINFMYASTKNAKFTLYGPDREELLTKTFTGNNVWYNIEKYLEPGLYYCSLETLTANDGGQTNLLINQTVYPLILSQESQTTNSYISVSTIDQPVEIRWVKGKLTNSELNSSKWKSGKVITDTKMFGVNMTGYYTVRVTDEYGNMFMQSIRVNNCDKKAPAKPVVKTYDAGTLVVSGTAEKNSLVTVYVNGKPLTCTASSKGNYKLTLKTKLFNEDIIEVTAQDISGNISEKTEVIVK
jgi:hypothetical protein